MTLPMINIFTARGESLVVARRHRRKSYRGLDRFEAARKLIVARPGSSLRPDLVESIKQAPPAWCRAATAVAQVIEPFLTDQWFVKHRDTLAEPAMAWNWSNPAKMKFVPPNWIEHLLRHWLREHPATGRISAASSGGATSIPAWFDEARKVSTSVATKPRCRRRPTTHHGDRRRAAAAMPDVLETWFSSAMWPVQHAQGWPDRRPAMGKLGFDVALPTSVLVTGFDIIFFWVARMIMIDLTSWSWSTCRSAMSTCTGLVRDKRRPEDVEVEGQHPRPARHHRRHQHLTALVAKRTTGPDEAAPMAPKHREEPRARNSRTGIPAHRRRRAALHHGRARRPRAATSSFDLASRRGLQAISATSCGTRRASR